MFQTLLTVILQGAESITRDRGTQLGAQTSSTSKWEAGGSQEPAGLCPPGGHVPLCPMRTHPIPVLVGLEAQCCQAQPGASQDALNARGDPWAGLELGMGRAGTAPGRAHGPLQDGANP